MIRIHIRYTKEDERETVQELADAIAEIAEFPVYLIPVEEEG